MISSNSRYANSQTALIYDPVNGQYRQVIVPSAPIVYTFQFLFHIVTGQEDNRIDLIAANYYGNAQMWWIIGDANPEIINWNDVPTGTVIRIPSIV